MSAFHTWSLSRMPKGPRRELHRGRAMHYALACFDACCFVLSHLCYGAIVGHRVFPKRPSAKVGSG